MKKYYTRACNFYYGKEAVKLIQNKKGLPLCGNKKIAFTSVEILSKLKDKLSSKVIDIKNIKNLNKKIKAKVKKDIKKISSRRKNFLKNINFLETSIMGVLNLTPDSFSDGGKYNSKKKAIKHIYQMINSGAKIIDVGGESTRPGSTTIPEKKEWKRIKHVLKSFKKNFKTVSLSLDTRKSKIMLDGIKCGVDIINDVSGYNFDKEALNRLKNFKVAKVIHHMKGSPQNMQNNPKYKNVLLDIYDFFEKTIAKTGKKNIILDPGIGFGKTLKHNLSLISKISLFHTLGFPILVGTSRKRFINQIAGTNDSKQRIGGTVASVLYLISQGVQIFRIHDVNEINQSIKVFKKILLK